MSEVNLNKGISIALCTCNGSLYLLDQLNSFKNQSLKPNELVICDDASTDMTVDIIKNFGKTAPFEVKLYCNRARVGVNNNFAKAIGLCENNYIAFSDQDDIWIPDKNRHYYDLMISKEKKHGKDEPILIHSDLRIIYSDELVKANSFMRHSNLKPQNKEPLKNLLVQNFVTGCTVMVNRALVDIALPLPKEVVMHDWWFALIAAARGKIFYISVPTVLYRQHEFNVVGSNKYYSTYSIKKLTNINILENDMANAIKQALALWNQIISISGNELPFYYAKFINYASSGNGIKAALIALRYRIKKYPWLRNLIFILLLIKGSYVKYLEK